MKELAQQAVDALLEQRPVVVTHPAGWARESGWPLPIKREKPGADGATTQTYRPLAILEYIHEKLAIEAAAQRAKERAAEGGEPGEAPEASEASETAAAAGE